VSVASWFRNGLLTFDFRAGLVSVRRQGGGVCEREAGYYRNGQGKLLKTFKSFKSDSHEEKKKKETKRQTSNTGAA